MTVLTNAMNTTNQCPLLNAAAKTKNLLKNPANGGIPAKENKAQVITMVNFGLVWYKPL